MVCSELPSNALSLLKKGMPGLKTISILPMKTVLTRVLRGYSALAYSGVSSVWRNFCVGVLQGILGVGEKHAPGIHQEYASRV
mgnify:CR=1 FL=1